MQSIANADNRVHHVCRRLVRRRGVVLRQVIGHIWAGGNVRNDVDRRRSKRRRERQKVSSVRVQLVACQRHDVQKWRTAAAKIIFILLTCQLTLSFFVRGSLTVRLVSISMTRLGDF